MGASGTTLCQALDYYRTSVAGTPAGVIAMHLMVTPEYIRMVREKWLMVRVYALDVDRGLSPPEVLREVPGVLADQERGLTDTQYVVPGAGGLGERITNVFV